MRILARPAPSSALVFSIRGAADVAVGAGGTGVTVAGVGSPEVMVAGAVAISRLARNHPAAAATITTVTITISVQPEQPRVFAQVPLGVYRRAETLEAPGFQGLDGSHADMQILGDLRRAQAAAFPFRL